MRLLKWAFSMVTTADKPAEVTNDLYKLMLRNYTNQMGDPKSTLSFYYNDSELMHAEHQATQNQTSNVGDRADYWTYPRKASRKFYSMCSKKEVLNRYYDARTMNIAGLSSSDESPKSDWAVLGVKIPVGGIHHHTHTVGGYAGGDQGQYSDYALYGYEVTKDPSGSFSLRIFRPVDTVLQDLGTWSDYTPETALVHDYDDCIKFDTRENMEKFIMQDMPAMIDKALRTDAIGRLDILAGKHLPLRHLENTPA